MKVKSITMSVFMALATIAISAQDIIILKDFKRIDAKIEEVSEETVKYKKTNNLEGPSFVINKSLISTIIYANGEAEVVNVAPIRENKIVSNNNTEEDEEDNEDEETKNHGVKSGFRGFYSIGGTIGLGANAIGRFEESVSIGGQVCPYFFVGVGLNYSLWMTSDFLYCINSHGITPFLHLRSDFLDKPITPFADVRIGYSWVDVCGAYFSQSVGCRFGGRRTNLAGSISIGYTLQMGDVYCYVGDFHHIYSNCYDKFYNKNFDGITLRGTFEF